MNRENKTGHKALRPVIEAENLYRSFQTNGIIQEVLRGVTCAFYPGEVIGIIGQSGVGKTTLIHLLSTLDVPTSGVVRLLGKTVSTLTEKELTAIRNEKLGFVFQMHHLLEEFSALENVCIPYLIHGLSIKEAEKHAKDLLELLDLSDRINSPVKRLSGGEQQRVAIARAMVKRPSILFADEPTGNLDESSTDRIADLFQQLNMEFKTTIVFVTHNPRLARIATRSFALTRGVLRELQDGS